MKKILLKIFIGVIAFFTIFGCIIVNGADKTAEELQEDVNKAQEEYNSALKQRQDAKTQTEAAKADTALNAAREKLYSAQKNLSDKIGPGKTVYLNVFDYENVGNGGKDVGVSNAQTILGSLITIIRMVGTGVAIAMLMWLGIHYMLSAPEEKTQVKKSMVPYVVGAVVLFSGAELLKIIEDFAIKNIN